MLYVINNFSASNRTTLDHDLDSILSGGNDGELRSTCFIGLLALKYPAGSKDKICLLGQELSRPNKTNMYSCMGLSSTAVHVGNYLCL